MGETADIRNAYNWNASKLAKAFDLHRNTVMSRLKESGIEPVGRQGNAPLYRLADAAQALFGGRTVGGAAIEPDDMDPQSRRAWYQSENERVKLEKDQGHLIEDHEAAREWSVLCKAVANGLDSLPDELERECGLPSEALELITAKIDALREQIYIEASA